MNINQAVPFSLLLNECVVNSYKHAFSGETEGNIYIDLKRNDELIHIEIADDGSGLPDSFDFEEQQTLGITLIRTLVSQLRGEAHYESNGSGTRFILEFTLEDIFDK